MKERRCRWRGGFQRTAARRVRKEAKKKREMKRRKREGEWGTKIRTLYVSS